MLRARRKYWTGLSYFGLDTKKSLSLSKCPNYVTVRTYFVTHFNNFTLFTRFQPLSGSWISRSQYKFYTLFLLILYKGNIELSGFILQFLKCAFIIMHNCSLEKTLWYCFTNKTANNITKGVTLYTYFLIFVCFENICLYTNCKTHGNI